MHVPTFYPEVHVIVQIDDPSQHYHIPLLLSARSVIVHTAEVDGDSRGRGVRC